MIFLSLPPTRERYVAEVRNLLTFRCRPICMVGPPRARLWELREALRGLALSKIAFRVGSSVVVVTKNGTYIY
jgi:hypothetical protein